MAGQKHQLTCLFFLAFILSASKHFWLI